MLSPTINSFRSEKRLTMLSSRSCISIDDSLYCVQQILGHKFRLEFPGATLILPLAASISTQHKRRMQSRIVRQLEIAVAITNHPASFQVDCKIRRGALDQ